MVFAPKTAGLVFYVSDIGRTEKFYNETLGLRLERMEGAEPYWLQASLAGGLDLMFFEMEAIRGSSPAVVFNIEDGGIDDIVASLAENGVTIVNESAVEDIVILKHFAENPDLPPIR